MRQHGYWPMNEKKEKTDQSDISSHIKAKSLSKVKNILKTYLAWIPLIKTKNNVSLDILNNSYLWTVFPFLLNVSLYNKFQ